MTPPAGDEEAQTRTPAGLPGTTGTFRDSLSSASAAVPAPFCGPGEPFNRTAGNRRPSAGRLSLPLLSSLAESARVSRIRAASTFPVPQFKALRRRRRSLPCRVAHLLSGSRWDRDIVNRDRRRFPPNLREATWGASSTSACGTAPDGKPPLVRRTSPQLDWRSPRTGRPAIRQPGSHRPGRRSGPLSTG